MENDSQELTKKERRELRRQEKKEELTRNAQGRTMKTVAVWVIALLVIGASGWGVYKLASSPDNNFEGGTLAGEITETDHKMGNQDASVVLLEYVDFQCPACGSYYTILKQLKSEYGDRVLFVLRHFPLRGHQNAEAASRAAQAASVQGKFWEMHDMIFETQDAWSNSSKAESIFEEYAAVLGLNVDQFREDVDSDAVKDAVQEDLSGGQLSGVQGTPTFFINGESINNPKGLEPFRAILDAALAQ